MHILDAHSAQPDLVSVFEDLDTCPDCGGLFTTLYRGLRDRLACTDVLFNVCRCTRCTLIFTNPQPTRNLHALYPVSYLHSAHTSRWNAAEQWYRSNQARFDFALLHKAAKLRAAEMRSYLDIGCGTGDRLLYAWREGCADVFGIDVVDHYSIALDKQQHFRVSGIRDFAPTRTFEVVSLFHVLEHVPDPRSIIAHIAREFMATHGYLVIQVPNAESMERKFFGGRWAGLDVPRHLWHFNGALLSAWLEHAGLEVRAVYRRNAALHPVTTVASAIPDADIQRIWVQSAAHPSLYWRLMKLVWLAGTALSIPLNVLQSVMNSATMLSIIAQKRQ